MENKNNTPTESESRLKAIIETAVDGIITIDSKGIMESFNSAAANLFGYTQEEVIGKNVKMLMPEPDRGRHDGYISNYQRTGVKKIIGIGREVNGIKKDGTIFPLLLSVSEVKLESRIIYTGLIHDMTKLKEAENAYRKLNTELEERVQKRTSELFDAIKKLEAINKKQTQAELEVRKALEKEKELNELKSKFVTLASHEFRTPLSSILFSTSLISKYAETGDKEKIDKNISRIKSAVGNLTGILNDFLSLSKLEEGIVSNNPVEFKITELGEEIKEEVIPILKGTQNIRYTHSGEEIVFLDKSILKNILLNLVSNAIKYSEKGTIDLDIKVTDKSLQLSVQDEGIGIPDEDKQFLFSRFFRANNAGNIQGTGLGLNIVKRYVELLQGTINFESELGKGTKFIIEIPSI